MQTDFAGRKVAVLGLARSGLASAEVLTQRGASVTVYDSKPADHLQDGLRAAQALGVETCVGGIGVDYKDLDYLITSPGVRKDAPALQEAVKRQVPVWSEIEAAYRIAQAPILAITGTNGKTTTAVLLGEMLRAAGVETYIGGNIAAGDIAMPLIKAASMAAPNAAIVAEISSFQLEWIETFRPKVAALLNITPDHQDRQTWEEYVAAKWRIFENQTEDDFAVLSEEGQADPRFKTIRAAVTVFTEIAPKYDLSRVKLPGHHNMGNILAAAAMATAFGIGPEPIQHVATAFTGVVHRLEYVATIGKVRYINNSMCTNAAAFEKSLEALPEPKVVIAGGVFKGDDISPLAQAVVKNNVRALVLIGRSAPEFRSAVENLGDTPINLASSMQEAVYQAKILALPGDTVVLAPGCASFDMFADFEDRGSQFKTAVSACKE